MASSVFTRSDIFSITELDSILALPEVADAKNRIDRQPSGSVYFNVELSSDLKSALYEAIGLDLAGVQSVPFRWIKGDTRPHIDNGVRDFDKTYLMYLTDSAGQLVLDDKSYPISRGSAYVFSEGLRHETTGTGSEPRLLLGPISEEGFAVGEIGINFQGGTIIYISQLSPTDPVEFSTNQTNWSTVSWPFQISNDTPNDGLVKVYFTTDITLNDNSDYFTVLSSDIQFGNETLNSDGTRPTINITATGYNGLIYNGIAGPDPEDNGKNNIRVYNLNINGTGGSLAEGAGWLGQSYFGKGATNNYIINCRSEGSIGNSCGGIVGQYSGSGSDAELTIIGCSSSGDLNGYLAGGIVGDNAGYNNGNVMCISCWSEGDMLGDGVGGIVGAYSGTVEITNCYSEGIINGNNAGGIIGSNSGSSSVTISKCYSRGNIIGGNSGGICGSFGSGTYNVTITNCYSTGNINGSSQAGGICGALTVATNNGTITNCYTSGTLTGSNGYIIGNNATIGPSNYSEAGSAGGTPGNWSNLHANTVLTGIPVASPGVGATWISTASNTPYEIAEMGYTPYSALIIQSNQLVRSFSQTVQAGQNTIGGLISSSATYSILAITGDDETITINTTTGAILTTAETLPGTYTITVRSVGSYNITEFILTVESVSAQGTSCCDRVLVLNTTYNDINNVIISGNTLITGVRRGVIPYSELIKKQMAQASRR